MQRCKEYNIHRGAYTFNAIGIISTQGNRARRKCIRPARKWISLIPRKTKEQCNCYSYAFLLTNARETIINNRAARVIIINKGSNNVPRFITKRRKEMYSSREIRILLESFGRFCKPNSCWSWKFFHPLADLFLDNSKFTLVNKNSKLQVLASTRIRNFRTVDQEWSSLWSIDRRSSNRQIRLFGVRISILFGLSIVRSIRRYKVRVEKKGGERIDYPSV